MSMLELLEQLKIINTKLDLLDRNVKTLDKTLHDAMDKHSAVIIAELKTKPTSMTKSSMTSFALFERRGTLSPTSQQKFDDTPNGNFKL